MLQRQLDRQRRQRPLQAWGGRDTLTFGYTEDELRRRQRDEWEADMRRFFAEANQLNLNAIINNNA